MAANLIARYIWEVNALAKARHGLSLEELNEQWRDSYLYDDKDIVRKTWWEHRNQIGVQFGIDIEFDKQNKRYFIKSRNEINRPAIQEWNPQFHRPLPSLPPVPEHSRTPGNIQPDLP